MTLGRAAASRSESPAPSADGPSTVRLRWLAAAGFLLCIAAQALSRIDAAPGSAEAAPWALVVGQTLWNAAQVALLLLLLGLWLVHRQAWVVALSVVTLILLPFAIYAISPGGAVLAAILLAVCASSWATRPRQLDVRILDAPARGTPLLAKVEVLALVCSLCCSLYNHYGSRRFLPWTHLFAALGRALNFDVDEAAIGDFLFTMGFDGELKPPYIAVGRSGSGIGAIVYLLIWSVLPFLYVLYFASWAKLAKDAPGKRLQQALCLYGIFHFLFLTDIVGYQFGRGFLNPLAEWAHWSERFVWRIAILLPLYQKLTSGQWLKGNGRLGVALHYAVLAWSLFFIAYDVVLFLIPRFVDFAGWLERDHRPFGIRYYPQIGYYGALVLMTLLYGLAALTMRCKRFSVAPVSPAQSR